MMVEFVENNIIFLFAAGIGILLLGQLNVFIFFYKCTMGFLD